MKKSRLLFIVVIFAVMLGAGLVAYYLGSEEPPPRVATKTDADTATPAQRDMKAWLAMTPEQRRIAAQKLVAEQIPPTEDTFNAPPFREDLRRGVAAATKLIGDGIADSALWRLYERCRAEHQADGLDEHRSHQECVVFYNRALAENIDTFFKISVGQDKLTAIHRLRFHPEEAREELNKIVRESDNVIERMVALKLMESAPTVAGDTPYDSDIYKSLDKYSAPEQTLLLDYRYNVPVDGGVADELTTLATQVVESVDTASQAALQLGKHPEYAPRLVDVTNEVAGEDWKRTMQSTPLGLGAALGECGQPCAAGFERLAADSTDPHIAEVLYAALSTIRDPEERKALASHIEGQLPPASSPEQEEQRKYVFARLQDGAN